MPKVCPDGVVRFTKEEIDRVFVEHEIVPFGKFYKQHLKESLKRSGDKIRNDYGNAALLGGVLGAAIAAVSSEKPSVFGLIASAASVAGSMSYVENLSDFEAIQLENSLNKVEVGAIAGAGSLAVGALVNHLLK